MPPSHGGETNGDSVDLWANGGGPGTGTEGGSGSGGGPGASQPVTDVGDSPEFTNTDPDPNPNGPNDGAPSEPPLVVGCADGSACEVTVPEDAPPEGPPQAFLSDLVNFHPAAPVASMEPEGWMVVGLETNFVASASLHVLSGVLLGFPAEVRFAPDGYRWAYGDGTSSTTTTPGSTWADLGVPEFSPTATSHIYRDSGIYTIGLEVSYSAEYRFAGYDWQTITGTVSSVGNQLNAIAGRAKTVLVERDCLVGPTGPGC